jgi:hypothetical protein
VKGSHLITIILLAGNGSWLLAFIELLIKRRARMLLWRVNSLFRLWVELQVVATTYREFLRLVSSLFTSFCILVSCIGSLPRGGVRKQINMTKVAGWRKEWYLDTIECFLPLSEIGRSCTWHKLYLLWFIAVRPCYLDVLFKLQNQGHLVDLQPS